jgi:hypothetical protein
MENLMPNRADLISSALCALSAYLMNMNPVVDGVEQLGSIIVGRQTSTVLPVDKLTDGLGGIVLPYDIHSSGVRLLWNMLYKKRALKPSAVSGLRSILSNIGGRMIDNYINTLATPASANQPVS